jgi:hypothetical protein
MLLYKQIQQQKSLLFFEKILQTEIKKKWIIEILKKKNIWRDTFKTL